MTNYRNILFAGALLVCFMYVPAQSEEYKVLNLEPGNYEFTETSSSTETPDEVVKKVDRCIKDGNLDPAGETAKKRGCKISNYKSKGNTLSYDYVCENVKASTIIKGSLEMSGSGKEFTWKKQVKTEIGEGQEFSLKSEGKAVRKGDCS